MKTPCNIILLFFLGIFAASSVFAETANGKPLNEKATAAAWENLNAGKFEAAITNADQCIDEFRGQARRLQEKLQNEKAALPTGPVNDDTKKKIFENGLLNDVGACYYIKGKAAEQLKRSDEAKKAYAEAKKLTYARVWDPQGWFWSPAEAAGDRLDALASK